MHPSTLALLACLSAACFTTDEDPARINEDEPMATESSCRALCEDVCSGAGALTDEVLTDEDCREQCGAAPADGSECGDCWQWMTEEIWDPVRVMPDCYCAALEGAANPYPEDCAFVVDEYFQGDSDLLARECAQECVDA